MKALVIDDEPFALRLLGRQLEHLGVEDLVLSERATDALDLLRSGPGAIDMIFCDLNMPDLDGVELVRHLVGMGFPGALVLVSGVDERILRTARRLAEAQRLNVLGALRKPVALEQLRQVLAERACGTAFTPGQEARRRYGAAELAGAIADGELVNYYQPKVRLTDGRLEGVETLVRWAHPRDGLVYPDQFIGTVEEHGLINDLTHTVLTGALRQARQWQDEGRSLRVAVNVSMENLGELDFPDRVATEAVRLGVPQTSLVLEVTESRLMREPLAAMDILTRLRLKRIGLSIDDFGTGHSSLAQLRDIPFDELKLDRGFVHGAGRDPALRAIFESNLGMARQLGLTTVAEGVGDRDDWEFVRGTGCDLAQGFFIARPMPAPELAPWAAEWERRRQLLAGV